MSYRKVHQRSRTDMSLIPYFDKTEFEFLRARRVEYFQPQTGKANRNFYSTCLILDYWLYEHNKRSIFLTRRIFRKLRYIRSKSIRVVFANVFSNEKLVFSLQDREEP